MKKMVFVVLALAFSAGLVYGAVKYVAVIEGTASISIDGADSTGQIEVVLGQISEMTGSGSPVFENKAWSRIVGSVIMPSLTDPGDSLVEGINDTVIIRYKFRTKWYTITAETDTSTLPGTTFFSISADEWAEYTESIYGDSTAATVKPLITNDFAAFMMDQMVLDYYVSDTAGTSGHLTGTLSWWFKFFEDE